MTIRQRFSDFIDSLQEPRRKYRAVCFLLIFVTLDCLLAGIYFLSGYFVLPNFGRAVELVAEIQEMYPVLIEVDASQYLWWCLPFFALAVVMTVFTVRYIINQRRIFARAQRPHPSRERIRARRDAMVEVRVHTVNPEKAKREDLRSAPPAWLLDPLAVVSENGKTVTTPERETVQQREQRRREAQQWQEPIWGAPAGNEQNPYTAPQKEQPPYVYSDFVQYPYSMSAPRNTVAPPRKKQADIPYAGSLQYVPRPEKKKSPYAPR